MNIMQTRWHATAEHTDMACNARQKKVQTQPGHGNARSARTKQCNVWCRKQYVCVVLCMLCRPRVSVDHPVPTTGASFPRGTIFYLLLVTFS